MIRAASVVMTDDSKAAGSIAVTLVGRVVSGKGEGALFTRLDWARAAFVERLGIDPFPGTLNLMPEDMPAWRAMRATAGIRIVAPDQAFCDARAWRVRLAGSIDGAIVVPEVPGYPDDKIEIIAALGLRAALGLADGDTLALEVLS
jgi:CTP-dependent riboflavin kinase